MGGIRPPVGLIAMQGYKSPLRSLAFHSSKNEAATLRAS